MLYRIFRPKANTSIFLGITTEVSLIVACVLIFYNNNNNNNSTDATSLLLDPASSSQLLLDRVQIQHNDFHSHYKNISIHILGDPIPVWNSVDTWKECHIIDVPDIPARAYVKGNANKNDNDHNDTLIQMICGAIGYHEMHGVTLFEQTRSCDIYWNATYDSDPSMFASNEFIDSTIRFDNGTVIALIHTEYPGNRYNACSIISSDDTITENINKDDENLYSTRQGLKRRLSQKFDKTTTTTTLPSRLEYPQCWTVTIGLAISYDWGYHWEHIMSPPNHLVASVPYRYNESQLAYGWGDPSNIVLNPNDGYYYVSIWNRNLVGVQEAGICIARTKHLLDPKSWKGWNGTHFSVQFVDPYRQKQHSFNPTNHVCQTITLTVPNVNDTKGDCNIFGLVWSMYLKCFVATVGCMFGQHQENHAFYFATSYDLIHWSNAKELYNRDTDLPFNVSQMTTGINYPSLLDPNAYSMYNDTNFYTIGKKPYLFWTSLGHSPYKDGRHLWATPIEMEIII